MKHGGDKEVKVKNHMNVNLALQIITLTCFGLSVLWFDWNHITIEELEK